MWSPGLQPWQIIAVDGLEYRQWTLGCLQKYARDVDAVNLVSHGLVFIYFQRSICNAREDGPPVKIRLNCAIREISLHHGKDKVGCDKDRYGKTHAANWLT